MKKFNSKQEGSISILAAILVLFSAMWNPLTSATLSIAILLVFAIYKFLHN